MRLQDRARGFAQQAHLGQMDKSGKPFIGHPAGVADILRRQGWSDEVVAAGWLHDTVEDTAVTLTNIRDKFGPVVATMVDLVSRRDGETYFEFIGRIANSGNAGAIAVKLADIANNSLPERNDSIIDPRERARLIKMRDTRYVKATAMLVAAAEDILANA
jgi:(p)ppGpp synthase/HD superfamily hydrolase